ncbi:MAG: hypothetical protein RLO17_16925 [Cyclobacteriaceae bacterium]
MSTKKVIAGVLGGITAGIMLGVVLASKRSLTLRKKMVSRGDKYLRLIWNKINHKKEILSEGSEQPGTDHEAGSKIKPNHRSKEEITSQQ